MNPIQSKSNRSGLPARIFAALAASPDIPHVMRPRSPFRRALTSAALLLAVLGFLRPAALHAAPWTPAELGSSSLALWLDASDAGTITLSGSTVSQWNDKSGNNRHVAQATATKRPSYANNILNGLSAVSFDGSDDSLFASAATITLSQPVHRFIACKFLTKTSKSVVFDSYASAPGFFFYNGENAGQWVYAAPSSISYGTADTSNNHIHYNHVNGASSYVSVDGTTTLTGPGNPGANTLQGVRIGHQRGEYPGYAFQGYVYEVVLVQGTLTADNRQKVEGYLASKWGLQANLPADHPYKSAAPESVDTNLLSFIWGSHTGVIDQNAKTVSLTVPYGTDVTTINPTCTVSSGATVSPASEANAGFIPSNLTVTYTVTSGASHTDYAATVTVEAVSSACDMLTFAAAGRSGVISGTNVTLLVPYDADVTTLAPTYTVSQYATGSPASDTPRNFTTSLDYIVTAQDGSTSKTYTVTVHKLAAPGTIATVPPGLQPGDQYRLVFVTSTTRDAASANIADYNTFVSGRAAAVSQLNALGTTCKAIAATLAVDVRTNTLTGATDTSVPIYRLDGAQVATGNTDLWDASIAYPISINESGTSVTARVWTGVGETFGNEYRLGTGGWNYYGWSTGAVKTPYANRVGGTGWTANLDQGSTASFPLYAISGILMVPLPGTDLLSFIWGSHIGVIDQEAKTVSLTVPYGTDLTTINPTCTVSSGATVSPASGANAGFTESNKTVTYTVTSGASHTDYAATVTVEPASSACDMLTFKSGNYSAALVGTNVSLMVPYGTDVTTLSPTYTMSPGATEDVSYPSGSARDFTNPQTYTITAQNGTDAKIYTVSVLTVPVTVPRGLNPGDSYRLVFVTNGTRDAVSTDIADYNGFVTTAATAAPELGPLSSTWTAIAATAVDVRTNTATDPVANAGTSVPIYNLGGVRVADGYADLWDASIANAIAITETGNGRNAKVWTGVGETFQNEYRLGGAGWCYYGWSTGTVKTPWGSRVGGTGWTANLDQTATAALSLYAISDILTVPVGGSAACNLISFNYGSAVGVITPGTPNTVLLTVPYGVPPLTAFTPAVTTSAFATFSPTGAQDFSNSQAVPVAYTVTAENGVDSKTYQVTVVKAAPSTACDMVSFTAAGVSGVITPGTPNTVVVTLPPETPVSALTPTVAVSPLATYAPTGSQNFTNSVTTPVPYTVTAEDGTTQQVYDVTIIVGSSGTSYATWAAANGASSDPLEDSNHNGIPNGIEYFMGGTQASPATLPPLVDNAGIWTWTIPYDPAALATYKFQMSGDLSDWTDAVSGDIEVLTGPNRLRLTLSSGMRFCRLLVTTP